VKDRFAKFPRSVRAAVVVLAHLWGPALLVVLPGFGFSAGEIVSALLVGLLLTASVSLPRWLRRRHGWWRALTVPALLGALLLLPVGLLASGGSLAAADDRRLVASWVLFGLLLAPSVQLAIAPLRLLPAFAAAARSLYLRMTSWLGLRPRPERQPERRGTGRAGRRRPTRVRPPHGRR
jgi:hypothetical protein